MEKIEVLLLPHIEELLKQQRLLLEMQKELIARLLHPPLLYKGEDNAT